MATLSIVPTSGQTLNDTRDPIRNNFISIQDVFAVDHATYGSVNEGNHNKVTFPVQAGAPAFTAGKVNLYNLLYATTSRNELFIRADGVNAIPLTARAGTNGSAGWSFLPSGILIQWSATEGVAGSGNTVINFPRAFTGAGSCWAVIISQNTPGAVVVTVSTFTNTSVTINNSTAGAKSINYFAIGIGL